MKKLIFAIIFAVSFQVANAQTNLTNQDSQAVAFLKDRCLTFNQGQVPTKISNPKALMDSLDHKKINYSYTTYTFAGNQINDETCMGGSSDAKVVGKKAIPFAKYFIYTKGGLTYIELVDGNSYF
jgi:hypothetical protein